MQLLHVSGRLERDELQLNEDGARASRSADWPAVRRTLAEDAEDLAAFEERAEEPSLDFEAVLKDVKRRGKL